MSRKFIEPQILVNTSQGLERINLDEALNLQVNNMTPKEKIIIDLINKFPADTGTWMRGQFAEVAYNICFSTGILAEAVKQAERLTVAEARIKELELKLAK